jgi:hypothetical protein
LPLACDAKVVAATIGGRPRRRPGRTRQWGVLLTVLCPCTTLTTRLQPLGPSPSRKPTALGFSPSRVRYRGRRGVEGEGEGEEERGRGASVRGAVGVPKPEAVRVHRGEGRTSRRGRGRSRPRRRGAGTEQEVECRREHLHRAAFFVKPATTTSPTRREPTRSLTLFCVVFPSLILPVGAPSSRRAPCTSRRRFSIDGRRVTPHLCELGTVAILGRNARRSR